MRLMLDSWRARNAPSNSAKEESGAVMNWFEIGTKLRQISPSTRAMMSPSLAINSEVGQFASNEPPMIANPT